MKQKEEAAFIPQIIHKQQLYHICIQNKVSIHTSYMHRNGETDNVIHTTCIENGEHREIKITQEKLAAHQSLHSFLSIHRTSTPPVILVRRHLPVTASWRSEHEKRFGDTKRKFGAALLSYICIDWCECRVILLVCCELWKLKMSSHSIRKQNVMKNPPVGLGGRASRSSNVAGISSSIAAAGAGVANDGLGPCALSSSIGPTAFAAACPPHVHGIRTKSRHSSRATIDTFCSSSHSPASPM